MCTAGRRRPAGAVRVGEHLASGDHSMAQHATSRAQHATSSAAASKGKGGRTSGWMGVPVPVKTSDPLVRETSKQSPSQLTNKNQAPLGVSILLALSAII